jgi:hypothetical protein
MMPHYFRVELTKLIGCGLLWAATASTLQAADPTTPATVPTSLPARQDIPVIPLAEHPPVMDGKLDDPQWRHAAILGPLSAPSNPRREELAQQPEYRTEVRMLWDTKTLYFAFTCRGAPIEATYTRHDDPLFRQDVVEVFLDVAGDQREYAELQANPAGVTGDYYHWCEPNPRNPVKRIFRHEPTWDLQGFVATAGLLQEKGADVGWIVEMSVPVESLLKKRGLDPDLRPGQALAVNVLRYAHPKDASGKGVHHQFNWSPTLRGCPHITPETMRPVRCETNISSSKSTGDSTGDRSSLILDGR